MPCYLQLDLGLCRGGRCKCTWPSSWLPSRCCNYTFVHVYSDQLNSFAVEFQKVDGANPFKVKVTFCCILYLSLQAVDDARSYTGEWNCLDLLLHLWKPCIFFSVLVWCVCNDSTFWVSILTVFLHEIPPQKPVAT